MNTVGTPSLWGGFAVVVAIMLAIDLLSGASRGTCHDHEQAAALSLVWVTLLLPFHAAFWWYLVQTEGRAVADRQALAFLTVI